MLLKSSDFVLHDLSADSVFEGCVDAKEDGDGGDGKEGRDDHREGRESGDDDDDDARAKDQKAYAYAYELELVLRKWFAIDPSRELRAFVRDGVLVGASRSDLSSLFFFFLSYLLSRCESLARTPSPPPLRSRFVTAIDESGISQRDMNYYEFLNEPSTQREIVSSFVAHWTTHVKPKWTGPPSCELYL